VTDALYAQELRDALDDDTWGAIAATAECSGYGRELLAEVDKANEAGGA
jgi:hypothetical protein